LLCHGTVCVVGRMRDLILQLSKSSIYSTKPIKTMPVDKVLLYRPDLNTVQKAVWLILFL
ncbi:hypothetical protein FCY21_02995, partial [Escherichia coli]|nr:hypothetical protein [Escherichia coli]